MTSSELAWLALLGAAFLIGFGAGYIQRKRLRYAVLVLIAFAPVLLIFVDGLRIGCVPGGRGGEECFGTGFGIVLFGMAAPVLLLFLLVGMWVNRWVRRKRLRS
jgi:hypothetical protein